MDGRNVSVWYEVFCQVIQIIQSVQWADYLKIEIDGIKREKNEISLALKAQLRA